MATISLFLSKNSQLYVKEGDSVSYNQPLSKNTADDVLFSVPQLLQIKPSESAKRITVKEGQHVQKGTILAKKSGMFGAKMITATFAGAVARIDQVKGEIHITPDLTDHVVIVSPVDGKVEKIKSDEIVIDFDGKVFFAKQGIGKAVKEELAVVSKENEQVELAKIKEDFRQKVLLGGQFARQVIEKACGLSIAAIIATEITSADLNFFEEHPMFHPTLMRIAKADYQDIAKHEGEDVVVEGVHKRIIVQS